MASFLSPSSDPRLFFLARCETIACEYLDRSRRSVGKSPAAPFLLFALRVGRLPIPSPIQNSAQISPSILPDRARLPKIPFPFHPCRVAFPAMKIIARSLIILLPPSRPFFRPPEVFHRSPTRAPNLSSRILVDSARNSCPRSISRPATCDSSMNSFASELWMVLLAFAPLLFLSPVDRFVNPLRSSRVGDRAFTF